MDLFTNHSKPCSIGQKHSHCLANYSNSVVIGYPGSQTTAETTVCAQLWNKLPEDVKLADNVDIFKAKLKLIQL